MLSENKICRDLLAFDSYKEPPIIDLTFRQCQCARWAVNACVAWGVWAVDEPDGLAVLGVSVNPLMITCSPND